MKSTPAISRFIFTALACEAKALISLLKLKNIPNAAFALYAHEETALIVSGCGKTAMAGAVAYSQAFFTATAQPVFINVGIAGHADAPLGTLFAAHKITDTDSGKSFYPQCVSPLPCPTLPIHTVSRPDRHYAAPALYDMEASGFYEMACRFTTAELIQAFKVVSDNRASPLDLINEKRATDFIAAQSQSIVVGLENLSQTARQLASMESPYYAPAVSRWHFSVTAQWQLKAVLQRWAVLTDNSMLDFDEIELKHAKAVLAWLEAKIAALPFTL